MNIHNDIYHQIVNSMTFPLVIIDLQKKITIINISGEDYWTAMSNISENYIYDQDNVRLRELSLGYNIPISTNSSIKRAYVQLVGRNLFFLSRKAEDIDPEMMLGNF